MPAPILTAENLTIGYGTTAVGGGINLALHCGELVCLLGPNGAGKSTLLRTLAAIQPPLAGRVLFEDRNIRDIAPRDLAKHLSMVLTERVNPGPMSVEELVALGRYPHTGWSGRLTERDEEIVQQAIQSVGATDLAHRSLSELSDGERQKVMVARALAQQPRVMILDEITAFLDLPRRVEIMRLLRRLAHKQHCAILLSSHDLELSLRCADRIWLMSKSNAGAALEAGMPEELILGGSFERAFAAEGLTFDRNTGAFRLDEPTIGDAVVLGSDVHADWTVKCLERLGHRVTRWGDAPIMVEVFTENGAPVWTSRWEGHSARHQSMSDLAAALQRRSTPAG